MANLVLLFGEATFKNLKKKHQPRTVHQLKAHSCTSARRMARERGWPTPSGNTHLSFQESTHMPR